MGEPHGTFQFTVKKNNPNKFDLSCFTSRRVSLGKEIVPVRYKQARPYTTQVQAAGTDALSGSGTTQPMDSSGTPRLTKLASHCFKRTNWTATFMEITENSSCNCATNHSPHHVPIPFLIRDTMFTCFCTFTLFLIYTYIFILLHYSSIILTDM